MLILSSVSISPSLSPDSYVPFYLVLFHSLDRPVFLFYTLCYLNALKSYSLCPLSVIYPISKLRFHFITSRCTKTVGFLDRTNARISEANNLYSCVRTLLDFSQAAPYIMSVSTNTRQISFRYTNVDLHYAFASTYRQISFAIL